MSVAWQIAGLAVLYAVGSPQSREGDERKEKKLDLILRRLDPKTEEEIQKLDREYAQANQSYLGTRATVPFHNPVSE
jgi:hypothetical protein